MTKEQAISRLRLNVYVVLFDSAYTSISIRVRFESRSMCVQSECSYYTMLYSFGNIQGE